MKYELKKIPILKTAVFIVFFTVLISIAFAFISFAQSGFVFPSRYMLGYRTGWTFALFLQGLLFGVILGITYNLIARVIGGLELTLSEVRPFNPNPITSKAMPGEDLIETESDSKGCDN